MQDAGVEMLDTLVVETSTYRNTATKTSLKPQETPGTISVVSSEELERQGAQTVSQALRYTPGVTPELRGGGVTRLCLLYTSPSPRD